MYGIQHVEAGDASPPASRNDALDGYAAEVKIVSLDA